MGKSKPAPPSCGGGPSAPAPSTPAPADAGASLPGGVPPGGGPAVTVSCPASSREVDKPVSETITNGNPASWNGTYGWDSKFQLNVADCTATVTIRLKVVGTITDDQKAAWKSAIEAKWNNKVYFCCSGCNCPSGLPCAVSVQYVDSGEHYEVTAQTPGADEG